MAAQGLQIAGSSSRPIARLKPARKTVTCIEPIKDGNLAVSSSYPFQGYRQEPDGTCTINDNDAPPTLELVLSSLAAIEVTYNGQTKNIDPKELFDVL